MGITTTFLNYTLDKKFGKLTDVKGIGSYANISAKIVSAEYAKKDNIEILSKNGKHKIKLTAQVADNKFVVEYFESDFSPKLEDVLKAKNIVIAVSNGGQGFGEVQISNYTKDDLNHGILRISMPNLSLVAEDNTYKVFNGHAEFVEDKQIEVNFKGVIPISPDDDFDTWISKGFYNPTERTVTVDMYNKEGEFSYAIPILFTDIDEDRAIKLFGYIKDGQVKTFAVKTKYKTTMKEVTTTSAVDEDFGITSKQFEFRAYAEVLRDDKGKLQFLRLENKGNFIIAETEAGTTPKPAVVAVTTEADINF